MGTPTVESDHLSMTIWHHDAPTGEGRTICKAVECNECGELLAPDDAVMVAEDDTEPLAFCKDCHQRQTEARAEAERMDLTTKCHKCGDEWNTEDMLTHHNELLCPICHACLSE